MVTYGRECGNTEVSTRLHERKLANKKLRMNKVRMELFHFNTLSWVWMNVPALFPCHFVIQVIPSHY